MPGWSKPILWFFAVLSALGLVLSVLSHVAAILGKEGPLGDRAFFLHIGIFVVWLPAMLVSNRLSSDFKRKDMWKATLRGCPRWMRYTLNGLFIYVVVNFLLFMLSAPQNRGFGKMSPETLRGFSGHWMLFYAAAIAIYYSGIHLNDRDVRRCALGHAVSPLAKFCEVCGQEIGDPVPQR